MTAFDDCFAAGDSRMSFADALTRLSAGIAPATLPQTVPLRAALGRVLAADLGARRDVPPHDNAAVDGYAVHFDDLDPAGETRLPVTGRIAAGHPLGRAAKRGEALEVYTGAALPAGPDTVFMVEDCRRDGDDVILPQGIGKGANFRHAGEDVRAGDTVLCKGRRLRAQEVGMAATLGHDTVTVFGRVEVAVFSTGDEVRDPGASLEEGCIFDANRYSIMALLEGLGCRVTDLGILPDTRETVLNALAAAAADHDLLITSGGVSMGAEDHVRAAVEQLGAIYFWNLAIKPGRPVALGHVVAGARDVPFVGLPGNPVAAMVMFMRIARPLIMLLAGATDAEPKLFRVPADFAFKKKAGRREFLRARLVRGGDGVLHAVKFPADGSGILSSMVEADGLVELGEEMVALRRGELVDFLPFSEVVS
jgi:molybdopterin molybdotransferase